MRSALSGILGHRSGALRCATTVRRFFAVCALGFSLSFAQDTAQVPKDPLALGNMLYEKGQYAEAAAQYFKATKSDAGGLQRAFAWFNLGNCQVQAKAYNKAIVAYRRSVEEAPNFSRGYQLLGDVHYLMGAIPEAVVAYGRLLELEENSVHAHQMLGECALKTGDVALALRHFDAALKLEPDLPDLYLAEAEAYADIRDYGQAEKVLKEGLLRMSRPTAEGYFYLGQLYELDEQPEKAVRAYEEGLLLAPKRADYYQRIAGIYQRGGDDFLSLLALEQGIRAGIRKPEFYLMRGTIFFRQQRYDRALAEFREAYALGSPQGRTGIENVAAAYFNAGKKALSDSVMAEMRK
jgi:tetratricopeptide (TPR) repeat protein